MIEVIKHTLGDQSSLYALVNQAVLQARTTNHPIMMSFVQKVDCQDPLLVFESLETHQPAKRFFWEYPAKNRALVGAGIVTLVTAHGSQRFAHIQNTWQLLCEDALLAYTPDILDMSEEGPLLFGGFSFDPQSPSTPLWEGFADSCLMLPRLLFRFANNMTTLTLTTLVLADDNPQQITSDLLHENKHARHILEQVQKPENLLLTKQQSAVQVEYGLTAHEWQKLVDSAVTMIKQEAYQKIVLARSIQAININGNFPLGLLLERLRLRYPDAFIFAFERGEKVFLGATPEQLVSSSHGQIQTMALAGSAARGHEREEDDLLGRSLLQNPKERQEHDLVVKMLLEALTPLCSTIEAAAEPCLLQLANIQHLQSHLVGNLLPGKSILEVLQSLHPTPAVGGLPRKDALSFIRSHECLDRGWYAAPIGWMDTHGSGEFAVALRSALLHGNIATLFAGCGIVADSQPTREYHESNLKLHVMMHALGVDQLSNL